MNPSAHMTEADGFTLLEVVIAFAILSLSAVVLFGGFSAALGTTDRADRLSRTESAASSILARLGTEIPLETGQRTGKFERGTWTLTVTPQDKRDGTPGESSWALYHVTLELKPSNTGNIVQIDTLRVGKPDIDE